MDGKDHSGGVGSALEIDGAAETGKSLSERR